MSHKPLNLKIIDFGPIKQANFDFGDFTILTGPQGSGKTIALELLKAGLDHQRVSRFLLGEELYKTDISYFAGNLLTHVAKDDKQLADVELNELFVFKGYNSFRPGLIPIDPYKPAHRVNSYWVASRVAIATDSVAGLDKFPEQEFIHEYKQAVQDLKFNALTTSIDLQKLYNGYKLVPIQAPSNIEEPKLGLIGDNHGFHNSRLSNGQLMTIPLVVMFEKYLNQEPFNEDSKPIVISIEEPELGLQIDAQQVILQYIIKLVVKGYRVVISTHSNLFVEFAWLLAEIKRLKAIHPDDVHSWLKPYLNLFGDAAQAELETFLTKESKVYFMKPIADGYFSAEDVSNLDLDAESREERSLAGMTTFSDKVSEVLSELYASASA